MYVSMQCLPMLSYDTVKLQSCKAGECTPPCLWHWDTGYLADVASECTAMGKLAACQDACHCKHPPDVLPQEIG